MALQLKDLVAKLIVRTDKKAAQDLEKDVTTTFGKMEAAAKKVGAAIVAAMGARAMYAIGKDLIKTAADAQVPWNRLANTLENVGIQFKDVERSIKLAARAMQDTTTVDGEAFAQILDELVAKTGDFNKAMQAVPLVADVAAKFFNNELGPATDLIGKLLNGNTRGMAQFGMAGKTAAESLKFLADASKGAATNELNTLNGKLAQIREEWNDLKEIAGEALIRMLTGTNDAVAGLEKMRQVLRSISSFFSEKGQLESRIAGKNRLLSVLESGGIARPFKGVIEDQIAAIGDLLANIRANEMIAGRPMPVVPPRVTGGGTPLPQASNVLAGVSGGARSTNIAARRGLSGIPGQQTARTGSATAIQSGLSGIDLEILAAAEERLDRLRSVGVNAAMGIAGAFQDAFGQLLSDFDNLGAAAEALGRGISGALLGGVAEYAASKMKTETIEAIEATAFALGLTGVGKFDSASAAWASAATHAAAAVAWGALAGGAGAAQTAVAGGSRGGRSGGVPSGASDGIGRTLENNGRGPQTVIYVDGFNPKNPVHVRVLGEGIREAGAVDSGIEVRAGRGR